MPETRKLGNLCEHLNVELRFILIFLKRIGDSTTVLRTR